MKPMKLLSLSTAAVLFSSIALASTSFKPGKYEIDTAHSTVGFEVQHLVISSVEGKFNTFNGTIDLADKLEKSKVEVTIDTKSIDTGNNKRDDHLRSADFFDANKIPTMTFKSTSVKGTLDNLEITGNLTMKGVTKKVTLKGKYLGAVKDGYGNEKVAFVAETELNRKDFGLNWNSMVEAGPVVGDKVNVRLKIQAAMKK